MDAVRRLLRAVDWCDRTVVERPANLGLGTSIRGGVSEVLARYGRVIVFEDDIECVPGTYAYLSAALERYADDPRVMSVSAWTHPELRPSLPDGAPHFDGRFACWGWGTWRRAWEGMDVPARRLLLRCRLRGRDANRYGIDIPAMARQEEARNIWAVRFCLLHILRRGLALHPPSSLTRHMGFADSSTSPGAADPFFLPELRAAPPVPAEWPEPAEPPEMPALMQAKYGAPAPLAVRLREWVWRQESAILGRIRRARESAGTEPRGKDGP